jgi:siroheme synthase-like protein
VPDYFPAFLDLRGRRCLVVGGGPVGERKAMALLECGARVLVVSPTLTPALSALAAAGGVEHRGRAFRRVDVHGCTLAVAATGREEVDRAVAAAARAHRTLVNVVDRPADCDVIMPSVLRRGELQIAVSTGGRSPALAREIRRSLEPLFASDAAAIVERAGRERADGRLAARTPAARARAGERVARRALVSAALSPVLPGSDGGFPGRALTAAVAMRIGHPSATCSTHRPASASSVFRLTVFSVHNGLRSPVPRGSGASGPARPVVQPSMSAPRKTAIALRSRILEPPR